MKVVVLGLGYIGLPTAAILASKKFDVLGVDVNETVVEIVKKGKVHVAEPDLEGLVYNAVHSGYLRAKTVPEKADVYILAVPTPFKKNHEPDLRFIESAVDSIAPYLDKENIVILESTSPVGTTEQITQKLQKKRPDLKFPIYKKDNESDIYISHCPERVLPGNILPELIQNKRIIGGMTRQSAIKTSKFYQKFVTGKCLTTDARTAELCKLVENSARDVNIAFANEISIICDKLDINVWDLISLANQHPRVNILQPGPGVGGHCIAVDPWFIVNAAPDEANLIRAARLINNSKPDFVLEKIKQSVKNTGKKISKISIACLGLTFKPDVADLRESPALEIAKKISEMGFKNQYLVDPNIKIMPEYFLKKTSSLVDIDYALKTSEIILLLVHHKEFKKVDLELVSSKQVIDTRGIWSNK